MVHFCSKVERGIQSYEGDLMKPSFYEDDRDNLTVNEEIELLDALSHEYIDDDDLDVEDDYID